MPHDIAKRKTLRAHEHQRRDRDHRGTKSLPPNSGGNSRVGWDQLKNPNKEEKGEGSHPSSIATARNTSIVNIPRPIKRLGGKKRKRIAMMSCPTRTNGHVHTKTAYTMYIIAIKEIKGREEVSIKFRSKISREGNEPMSRP